MSKMICIETFPRRIEAELAKTVLEAEGIKSMVSVDDCGGARPELVFASGGARLFVLEENTEPALAALRHDED